MASPLESTAADRGPAPAKLGKYHVLRQIARGGMGVVYEAEDPDLKRRIALKVVDEIEAGKIVVERLHREAAIAGQLQHPNIVRIHEVGMAKDSLGRRVHFIAMDFVDGRTFAEVLKDPRVPRAERVRMLEDVAHAVAYAHERGVIHRDLKPGNVLVDHDGRVLLTDFGLARADEIRAQLTRSNAVMGTPYYMAPEQVEGRVKQVDARTDVYALGVMLYEILTGHVPFQTNVAAALYRMILTEEPVRPSRVRVGIEVDLQTICLKAMEKERGRRYPSAVEFAEDLARYRKGDPILARPSSTLHRFFKVVAQRRTSVLAAIVALVAGLGVTFFLGRASTSRTGSTDPRLIDQLRDLRGIVWRTRIAIYQKDVDWEAERRAVRQAVDTLDAMSRKPGGDSPDVWTLLGMGWHFLGEDQKAEAALLKAESLASGAGLVRLYLGRIYLERAFSSNFSTAPEEREARLALYRENTQKALTYLSKPDDSWMGAEEIDRALAKAYEMMARKPLNESADSLHELRELCEDALRQHKQSTGSEEFWIILAYIESDDRKKIALLTNAINRRPCYPWAYFLRAQAKHRLRDTSGLEDYARAVFFNPRFYQAYHNRGEWHRELGNLGDALEDFNRAIQINPDLADLYNSRAAARGESGDRNGQLDDLNRAIELNPRYAMAYLNRGLALRARGQAELAIEDYTKAIGIRPAYLDAYINRAVALHVLKRNTQALADCDAAVRIVLNDRDYRSHPNAPKAWTNRAVIRHALGDRNGAIEDLRDVLEIMPEDWPDRPRIERLILELRQDR